MFLKSMPVCLELSNWNFGDSEQEINNPENKRNKN
jgi:hypothetical protein